MTEPLLSVRNLVVEFDRRGARVMGVSSRRNPVGSYGNQSGETQSRNPRLRAVDCVSFDVAPGETVGLVGESGCGKTTLTRAILRLTPITGGSIRYEGIDVLSAARNELPRIQRSIQVVFQDPTGSLNPRMRIGDIIAEPLVIHRMMNKRKQGGRVAELLDRVGLPSETASRYPHELSGGQRQRVAIARAIAPNPRLIICDEPVSALDVSIQAQIINLLDELRRELDVAYLFIAHNLAVVRHFAQSVLVMHNGRIVEQGDADELFERPQNPYTSKLIAAIPRIEVRGNTRQKV